MEPEPITLCDDWRRESTPISRTARVTWALAHGEGLRVADIQRLTGLGKTAAYELMCEISRECPVICVRGVWQAGSLVWDK